MNSRQKAGLIAGAVLAVVAVGGIFAYLYDTQSADNVFTIGKVTITLNEEEYDNHEDERKGLYQNQLLFKDPKISNTGLNPAVVFLRVDVPLKTVYLADEVNGGTTAPKLQEVFWMLTEDEKGQKDAHHFSPDWILLEESAIQTGSTTKSYVFGYHTMLAPDSSTSTVFDYVKYKQVVEGQLPPDTSLNINVTAYAIQAEEIQSGNGSDFMNLSGELDKDTLKEVYDIMMASPPEK